VRDVAAELTPQPRWPRQSVDLMGSDSLLTVVGGDGRRLDLQQQHPSVPEVEDTLLRSELSGRYGLDES
jgi:hypothetical protein